MNVMETDPFRFYSIYYDLVYSSKNYEEEAMYVHQLLQQSTIACKEILELGSGTGNYAQCLCKRGYKITGIEKSKLMLDQSLLKNINGFYPIVGDMVHFELDQQFDAAVSLFHVMSYLSTDEQVIGCLEKVGRHLKKDGAFVFDVWHSPAVFHQKPSSRVKQAENDQYRVVRHAEPVMHQQANLVDVVYEIVIEEKETKQFHALKEVHTMRHYSIQEIERFAKLSGFNVIKAEEFLTAEVPSDSTWGVCYTLQKK